jgi:hypothetical protein
MVHHLVCLIAVYLALGDDTLTNNTAAVTVLGIDNAISMGDAINGQHSCAVLDTGGVSCWGSNTDGQLVDSTVLVQTSPVPVLGLNP